MRRWGGWWRSCRAWSERFVDVAVGGAHPTKVRVPPQNGVGLIMVSRLVGTMPARQPLRLEESCGSVVRMTPTYQRAIGEVTAAGIAAVWIAAVRSQRARVRATKSEAGWAAM
jgi:hypothetical protein